MTKLTMLIQVLLYLTFFLYSLGQIGRISFLGQQVNIYLYESGLFSIYCLLFIKYKFALKKDFLEKFKLIYIFFAYLFFVFLLDIVFYKPVENIISFLYYLRLLFYFHFFFYLFLYIKKNPKFLLTLKISFLFLVLTTAIVSLVQYFFYPELRNLLYAGWDPHLYRLFGTFFDTSIAAGIYGLILLGLFFAKEQLSIKKWFLNGLLFIYLLFVVFTYSRNVYLSLLICSIVHALSKRWYRGISILLAVFLLFVIFSPKRPGEGVNLTRMFSVQSRIVDYRNAIKIWSKKPLFGIGYNRIRYEKVKRNIIEDVGSESIHSGASFHSSFLIILVTSGLVGLVLFTLVLFKLAAINEFAKYAVLFLSLMSFSDNLLLHPFILFLLFISLLLFNPSRKLQ